MKKTIFACLALAYAGLAFSEPAILTEAKNYKLSNGQTMEQALANYSHCDQKEWGGVDNRAIFVCRDKLYKETLDAAYKTVLDRGWAIDDATLEKASKTLGLSKELVYESIKEQRKNARSALITNIENMERQRDSHVVNSATQSVVGKDANQVIKESKELLNTMNALSTKEDYFVVYFDRVNEKVVPNYGYMHYWVDVNQNVNLKGIGPAMASEEKLTKNVFFGDVLNKDDFATFGNGVVKAYLKAKKESSK